MAGRRMVFLDQFDVSQKGGVTGAKAIKLERGGQAFVVHQVPRKQDMRYEEWDGEQDEGPELEGSRTIEEREDLRHIFERRDISDVGQQVEWEPEPQLTADQWVS